MVWTLSIVIILLFLLPIYYREARIYDAHGAYKHTSHVVVSLNSVTLNLKRTHIRTYPGSLSFFLLRHQSSTFFFFLSGIFYIRRRVLILTHGVLYTQHTACRRIYTLCVLYTHAFLLLLLFMTASAVRLLYYYQYHVLRTRATINYYCISHKNA